MGDSSASSSPSLAGSTPPSSVPSPEIQSLSLSDSPKVVSEEDKAEALKLKGEANKAFVGAYARLCSSIGYPSLIYTSITPLSCDNQPMTFQKLPHSIRWRLRRTRMTLCSGVIGQRLA